MTSVLPKNEIIQLTTTAETEGLTLSDLAPLCETFSIAPSDVLNELAIAVSVGYLDGTLSYEFCDDVMNGIIHAVVDASITEEMPQPAFSLWQAFDQGEWFRGDDLPDTDTGEKYTKPAVVEIMRMLRG